MIAKTEQEIEALKKIGKIVAEIREAMKEATVPGKTTKKSMNLEDASSKKKMQFPHQSTNMISLAIHASASTMKLHTASQVPASFKMAILLILMSLDHMVAILLILAFHLSSEHQMKRNSNYAMLLKVHLIVQ